MHTTQTGILENVTKMARYLEFSIDSATDVQIALQAIVSLDVSENLVLGIGQSLLDSLSKEIPGLYTMPAQTAAGIDVPSTPGALWCWLRGSDRGEIFHRSRQLEHPVKDEKQP